MVAEHLSVFDELAYFLANLSPKKVLTYKASAKAQARVNYLLEKNRTVGLTTEDKAEMERHMAVEHIVRLAKRKHFKKSLPNEYLYLSCHQTISEGKGWSSLRILVVF